MEESTNFNLHESVLIFVDIFSVVVLFYQEDNKQVGIHPFPLSFCTILSRWIHPLSNQRHNMISAMRFIIFRISCESVFSIPSSLSLTSVISLSNAVLTSNSSDCPPLGLSVPLYALRRAWRTGRKSFENWKRKIRIDGMRIDVDWIRLSFVVHSINCKETLPETKMLCLFSKSARCYIVRRRYSPGFFSIMNAPNYLIRRVHIWQWSSNRCHHMTLWDGIDGCSNFHCQNAHQTRCVLKLTLDGSLRIKKTLLLLSWSIPLHRSHRSTFFFIRQEWFLHFYWIVHWLSSNHLQLVERFSYIFFHIVFWNKGATCKQFPPTR